MSILDKHIPLPITIDSPFPAKVELMHGAIAQAESVAEQSRYIYTGRSLSAFEVTHAGFTAAKMKVIALLDIARASITDAQNPAKPAS